VKDNLPTAYRRRLVREPPADVLSFMSSRIAPTERGAAAAALYLLKIQLNCVNKSRAGEMGYAYEERY
jgi:hypothetical protein